MATSLVQGFLETPSVEVLDVCRKVDLYDIAAHFQVPVPKQATIAVLWLLVWERLVERQVLSSEGTAPLTEAK